MGVPGWGTRQTAGVSLLQEGQPLGKARLREIQSSQSDFHWTQLVQQPDVMYFIPSSYSGLYCLLLFPQLDVNRL